MKDNCLNNKNIMESYPERLERKCKETDEKFPEIKEIINEILRINSMSSMMFDYNIEKISMMYSAVKKILNKE